MDTLEFLRLVTPSRGYYFAAVPSDTGRGFRHHLCETHAELTAKCLALDEQGATTYFALGSFREPRVQRYKDEKPYWVERVQENVQLLRAFWLDLDVGVTEPGKAPKYASQQEAVIALGKFINECGLPQPMLVSSGYGVHVYWPLTEDVMEAQWRQTATDLKTLCAGLGMLADPMRTADSASVLRPVGTHNYKVAGDPKPVTCSAAVAPVEYGDFQKRLTAAIKAHGVAPKMASAAKVNQKINEGLGTVATYQKSSAYVIAEKCNQIREMRDRGGDIAEPHWYAAIQLLNKTVEADTVIHQWSSGYKGYSRDETDAKIRQIQNMGPSLCSTFESRNPEGCANCPFAGSINSPIQLGITLAEAAAPRVKVSTSEGVEEEITLPPPPAPFKRGDGDQAGLYVELDGVPIQFYPYDLYPVSLEYDESDQYETTRVRHYLPMEGWKEFTIQSSLVHSPREFNVAMANQSVKYSPEGKFKDAMRLYMSNYLQRIQQSQRVNVQHMKMGWKENNTQFLMGGKMFVNDGSVRKAGVSSKIISAIPKYGPKGDFNKWKEITRKLNEPGYEAHAFAMMIGFGAPLIQLLKTDGVMVNMTGLSGKGKSSVGRLMMSIYGETTKTAHRSTINARLQKLGAYGNMPMYIDELSNIEPKELSELAYCVANGIGKDRLRSDSSLQEAVTWRTIVLASSNHSLHEKLQLAKGDPEAERLRIFEFDFPEADGWFKYADKVMHPTLNEHYGHAGEAYIHWLVQQDKDKLVEQIIALKDSIAAGCNSTGNERFWMNGAACAVFGGLVAKSLGLIEFDPLRVLPWIYKTVTQMRGSIAESRSDEIAILATFLDENQRDRIIVHKGRMEGTVEATQVLGSASKLSQRLESDTGRLYINRNVIAQWAGERGFDFRTMRDRLRETGVLLDDERITLGKGTKWGGFQVWCWVVDMNHPAAEAMLLRSGHSLDHNEAAT